MAAGGTDVLQQQCSSCHALTKPADASLDRLWERKGPDLYYAGVKFNREWLEAWLQNPTTIRSGGVMYAKAIKASADKTADTIDGSKLTPHVKLDKADAGAAADALMKLGTDLDLVQKGAFKNGAPGPMAKMLFSKLRGCSSCHSVKAGSGGLSGPELADAGSRLQPDFVVAYINNPQKFDPHIWMPTLGLTDADVQKLTGYLLTLKHTEAQ
ncbi:MAG TPA: c-type cytochrome [Rhodanobacter sp.]|nr:c-type cytochrome [Rhodanobacter sp.]